MSDYIKYVSTIYFYCNALHFTLCSWFGVLHSPSAELRWPPGHIFLEWYIHVYTLYITELMQRVLHTTKWSSSEKKMNWIIV